MSKRSHKRVFWEQISEDPEVIGTLVIGTIIFLGEYLNSLANAENITVGNTLPGAIGLLALLSGITLYFHRAYRTTNWILSVKHVPIVIVVGQSREAAEATLEKAKETISRVTGFNRFKQLEKSFNVRYRDLIVHRKRRLTPDRSEWNEFIEDGQRQICRFTDRIPGDKQYHVFIYGPASLALGFGATFGSKHRIIAYQFIDSEYQPVLDLSHDIRRIKATRDGGNQYVQTEIPATLSENTAITFDLASHPVTGDTSSYLESIGSKMPIVEVKNMYGGNFKEPDWSGLVQEIYNLLTLISATKEVKLIHLFQSMPVALAFGVGAALGTFTPITLYNWETQQLTYHPVLELHEIETII